jgi:hypothetical protein
MMIPLHSQLATNTPENNHFTTHALSDAIHDDFPGLEIPVDQVIYNHPIVIEKIVAFARDHFGW